MAKQLSVKLSRFVFFVTSALMFSNCAQVRTSDVSPIQVVEKEAENMLSTVKARPANLEELLQQQAIIDNIMSFLKEEIKEGEAAGLIQRAEERLQVKYNFVANRHSREGKDLTDFLTNAKVDENGKIYEEGRVDVYDGGLIPGTMYSTYYESYSEGSGSKYIDLIIKYDRSSGMPCLNMNEFYNYALREGYVRNGGQSFGRLYTGFLKTNKREILTQLDDSGERRNLIVRRYSPDYPYETEAYGESCAKKIGIRIDY